MKDYYSILTPQLIQDNKMHVLYPVNLYYNDGGSNNNTVHNSRDKSLSAACGTIWISTNPNDDDEDNVKAGFIHGTDNVDIQFRHKEFYPCIGKYEGSDMSGVKDISKFTAYSYSKMLTADGYSSPHFGNSNQTIGGVPLVSSNIYNGMRIYTIEPETVIHDRWFSSYYVKPEGNRLNVYYLASKLRTDFGYTYTRESEHAVARKLALRNNVDTMLKYIVSYTRPNGITILPMVKVSFYDDFYRSHYIDQDYTTRLPGDQHHIKCTPFSVIGIMPVYLSNINNDDLNLYSSNLQDRIHNRYVQSMELCCDSNDPTDYISIKYNKVDSKAIDRTYLMNKRVCRFYVDDADITTGQQYASGEFTDMLKQPINMITMGRISKVNADSQSPQELKDIMRNSTYIGLCNDVISCIFLQNSAYLKIFSNDAKWKSVPFNDKLKLNGKMHCDNSNHVPMVSDEKDYCDKYLAPYTLDHYIREINLKYSRDTIEAYDNHGTTGRIQKVMFSKKLIKCYTSTRSGTMRLYNSANLINSIKWGTDANGKHIMVFENTADMLKDNIN